MEKIIGINAVTELLNSQKKIQYIEIFENLQSSKKMKLIKEIATKKMVKINYTEKRTDNSQGVVAYIDGYNYYVTFEELLENVVKKEKSIILILDGIQDPRNFGAIIRSAEVFGVLHIIIPERNSIKINETVIKTSTGAIEHINISIVKNISEAIDKLKKYGFWIYGAEGTAEKQYYKENYPNKTVLVLGSEGSGIRKKIVSHCDILVKIPMKGRINSLNVSVAGGIILSEISKSIY